MKAFIFAVLCLGVAVCAAEPEDKFEYKTDGLNLAHFDVKKILSFHTERAQTFARTEGMGISRIGGVRRTAPLTRTDGSATDTYVLASQNLVGIAMQKEPQAYVGDFSRATIKTMTKLKDLKVTFRALTDFEKGAIEKLKAGSDLVAIEESNTLHIVGAIRATNSCLTCHGAENNELLGAFAYSFKLRPTPTQQIQLDFQALQKQTSEQKAEKKQVAQSGDQF